MIWIFYFGPVDCYCFLMIFSNCTMLSEKKRNGALLHHEKAAEAQDDLEIFTLSWVHSPGWLSFFDFFMLHIAIRKEKKKHPWQCIITKRQQQPRMILNFLLWARHAAPVNCYHFLFKLHIAIGKEKKNHLVVHCCIAKRWQQPRMIWIF